VLWPVNGSKPGKILASLSPTTLCPASTPRDLGQKPPVPLTHYAQHRHIMKPLCYYSHPTRPEEPEE